MSRIRDLVGMGALAAVLTLGYAAAEAQDIKVQRKPAAAPAAQAEPVMTPEDKAEVGQAAAERIVEAPACGRKVKVVYAGYGESSRAACASPAR